MVTFDSSSETVAIIYDIENSPFEMLDYTLGKARRYQPCRTIVISDWDARPQQKRWEKLMRRPGFTFRQIDRTFYGKNSLDYALFDSAKLLYDEGVRRFFIITTDSDFIKIAEALNLGDTPSYIIGVGTKQASENLRNAYDEFFCYPPDEDVKRGKNSKGIDNKMKEHLSKNNATNSQNNKNNFSKANKEPGENEDKNIKKKTAKTLNREDLKKMGARKKKEKEDKDNKEPNNDVLTVKLPRTLRKELEERMVEEGISMNELVTYLLTRGLLR